MASDGEISNTYLTPARRRAALACVVLAVALAAPLLLWGPRRELWLVVHSLILAGATCVVSVPLGVVLAALLARTDLPGRHAALLLLAAMLFMPLYLQTAAWDAGFGRQGWYSVVLGSLAAPPLEGWRGAIWVHALAAIPWVTLIVAVGLWRINPEWEEAALLDASAAAVFWRITLPHAWSSLALAALWIVITTVGELTVADMYQVNTYARELYIGFALGELLIGAGGIEATTDAPAGAWPGLAITGWMVIATIVFVSRLSHWDHPASLRPPFTFRLGRAKFAAVLLVAFIMVLVAGVPLGNLIYQTGIAVKQIDGERVRIWSASKFAALLLDSPWRFSREIRWTTVIGGVSASVALTLGAPLAWLARRGGRKALPALGIAVFGLAIPGPLIALTLIAILNREEAPVLIWLYDRTIFAPTVVLLLRALPWAIGVCWFAFRSIPTEALESAELDGAGPLDRFIWIVAPMCWRVLALAWLVAFVVASGDLTASILVTPPGVDTLPIRIFGLIHAGVDDQVAAVCIATALSVAVLTALAYNLWRRSRFV